ncbi:Zinc-Activated Ligand-Gated Ion Channel [Manis pentadactyla]|nr:Zinc-Activated Ligand-Gated Ion Channel [Manis pentadactyla]
MRLLACVGRPRARKQKAGRAEAAPAGGAAAAPAGFQRERLNLGRSPAGTARGDGRVAPGDGRRGGRVPTHGQITCRWLRDRRRLAREHRGQGVPGQHPAQEPPEGVWMKPPHPGRAKLTDH